jgi:hypothetical protein
MMTMTGRVQSVLSVFASTVPPSAATCAAQAFPGRGY